MEKVKSVAKSGWHPKKESWRGDFKVASLVGKGKGKDSSAEAHERRALPLASLKDPEAFEPPPKRVTNPSGVPISNNGAHERDGSDIYETRATEEIEYPEIRSAEEAIVRKKPAPPIPCRADSTGSLTSDAPKLPLRARFEHNNQPARTPANPSMKPKPSLPPRLPPRQNSTSVQIPSSPPPAYSATVPPKAASTNAYLNQGALARLGSTGINVPGLGIGGGSDASKRGQQGQGNSDSMTSPVAGGEASQPNDRQSGFSRLSPSKSPPPAGLPSQGTTFAQKQAALKTASAFRNNPSSVSLADAKATASTMNNFRERHGDQVTSGLKSANALNHKYDLSSKFGGYTPPNSTGVGTLGQKDSETPSMSSGWKSANALNQKYNLSSKVGGYTPNSTAETGSAETVSMRSSGWKSANAPIQKYDLSSKVGDYASSTQRTAPESPPAYSTSGNVSASDVQAVLPIRKKPPPPPPKKKPFFKEPDWSTAAAAPTPPPVPLSSKPKAY